MRVFVAGAAGAIGRQLVAVLVEAGQEVTGTTRSAERAAWLRSNGAQAVVVDVLDADALRAAVVDAGPDVVVHQLTDLAAGFGDEQLRANARLRQVGTRNLMDATVAAGASRMVAQSGAWLYAPGPEPHDERDPLIDPANVPDHAVLPGILELERIVTSTPGVDGLVLRYGFLYGPGTDRMDPGDDPDGPCRGGCGCRGESGRPRSAGDLQRRRRRRIRQQRPSTCRTGLAARHAVGRRSRAANRYPPSTVTAGATRIELSPARARSRSTAATDGASTRSRHDSSSGTKIDRT